VDTIAATNQVTFNATLRGLPDGDWYVRAFIDHTGTRAFSYAKPWGYGCYVGTDRKDVYSPRPYTIKTGSTFMPEAVVYIEDTDRNNDGLPDAWASTSSTTAPGGSGAYTVLVNASGVASAFNVFAKMDAGVLSLPYVSMLAQFSDDEDISALRLEYAMAMSGVASVESAITPEVRITAFSVDKGVDIAVDMPTTINPSTLKATNIGTVNVPVTLKLWKTDSLDGTWTEIGSVSETFAVNTVNGKLDQAKLDALNASLKAQLSGQSGFFKVTVE
jgi:hypothetical protein